MTYTKEEQAANRAKWVAALRSGEYRQGRGVLRTDSGEYCCLGVACEIAVGVGVIPPPAAGFYDHTDTELPHEVKEWLGLFSDYGDLGGVVQYELGDDFEEDERGSALTLIDLNDTAGWTFDQIADVIESGNVKLQEDDE